MKKAILLLLISAIGITGYAQSKADKEQDKRDLGNIKRLYDRLKEYKIDTKSELSWEYTYQDTSETQLQKLGAAFEKGGLTIKEIVPAKKGGKYKLYMLTVAEVKKYAKPEQVHLRAKHLNEVAAVYGILYPSAAVNGRRMEHEGEIDSYQKVGKKHK